MKGVIKQNSNTNSKKKKKTFKEGFTSFWGYFRTLYSNTACIERGTGVSTLTGQKVGVKKTWWIAVLFFIFAVALSIIPLTVHTISTNGSDIFASSTFGMKEALYSLVDDNNANYHTVDGEIENIRFVQDGEDVTIEYLGDTSRGYSYIGYHEGLQTNASTGTTSLVKDFEIFYLPNDNLNLYLEAIQSYSFTVTQTQDGNYTVTYDEETTRACSFILFTDTAFYASFMPYNQVSYGSSLSGDYKFLDVDVTFKEVLVGTGEVNEDTVFTNFENYLDKVYTHTRNTLTLVNTGIITGVNAGITLLLGLIVFLMTRGKNNPNREIKWYQAFLLTFYASLTPGLLALIFGFMFSGYEIMLYIMFFGVRAMWMSLRSLRPTY